MLCMCSARARRCRAQRDVLFISQLVTILPHIPLSHFCRIFVLVLLVLLVLLVVLLLLLAAAAAAGVVVVVVLATRRIFAFLWTPKNCRIGCFFACF